MSKLIRSQIGHVGCSQKIVSVEVMSTILQTLMGKDAE